MLADLSRVLFHESTILSRLDEMAHTITWDYRDKELTCVAVLNGSFMFLGDLLRRIPIPLHVDCLSVSSYSGHRSTGVVTFDQTSMPEITGRHVLVLDDILDGGATLHAVRERLLELNPASLKIGVLLRKNRAREMPVEADYIGFDIADEFVVGYGLDFMEQYRNLPLIGVLSEEVIAQGMAKLKQDGDAKRVINFQRMSLQELERVVQTLPAPDLREFSAWFDEWRAEQWDRQIEQDALAGKLDHLAEAALAEFQAGRFTRLP